MARIFDVVEYPSEMKDEIVHRFPEQGIADVKIGSQIIVGICKKHIFLETDALWMNLGREDIQ